MSNSSLKKIILPLGSIVLISILIISILSLVRKPQKFFITEPDTSNPLTFDAIIKLQTENVDLTQIGEVSAAFSPELETNVTITESGIIIDHEIFKPGETYSLLILNKNSQLFSTTFKIKELGEFSDEELERYSSFFLSQNSSNEEEWRTKLPYFSESYTIIYDYENDVLRVRINNSKNLSPDALQTAQDDSVATIANLGIPPSEKVVFILD